MELLYWGHVMYWDNGKENGNYRGYRGYRDSIEVMGLGFWVSGFWSLGSRDLVLGFSDFEFRA